MTCGCSRQTDQSISWSKESERPSSFGDRSYGNGDMYEHYNYVGGDVNVNDVKEKTTQFIKDAPNYILQALDYVGEKIDNTLDTFFQK